MNSQDTRSAGSPTTPKVSPPDKRPSLRYPRLANITIQRSGPETVIDVYYWTSRYPHSTLLRLHVGVGDDCWLSPALTGVSTRADLEPLPTFAAWLFQYLWFDPWRKQTFADVGIGTFSLRASDYRIPDGLRNHLSRLVRPVIAELEAEAQAVAEFQKPAPNEPVKLTLVRRADAAESEAQP